MSGPGLGGIAATEKLVIVVDRDAADTMDVFRCLAADDGRPLWTVRYLARGKLDYGNSSRATPLVYGKWAFLFGALGNLNCVELETGKVVWKKDLRREFGVEEELSWGFCSSPLVVDDKLIVNPGGKDASLVALQPATGEVIWKTPGEPAGLGSLIVGELGGKRQIVGHDRTTLGGWDIATGARLWTLTPKRQHDFNVPTPVAAGGQLLVSTENNGTRLYNFSGDGKINPEPVADNFDLSPDSHTPVVVGARAFGVWGGLHALDLRTGLKPIWRSGDRAFSEYASIIATPERLLLTTQRGELLLIDAQSDTFNVLARVNLFDDDSGVYSHPAIVGRRLYLRSSTTACCLELDSGGGRK